MKDKITGIVSVVLIAVGLICSSAFAFRNIIKLSGLVPINNIEGVLSRGDYVEGDLTVPDRYVYRMDHSEDFFLKWKEIYYAGFDEENNTVYFIKAGKGLAKKAEANPVQHIKGKVKKADSDVKEKLAELGRDYLDDGYKIGYSYEVVYIDTQTYMMSIINVAAIIVMIAGLFLLGFSPVSRKPVNTFVFTDHLVVGFSLVLFLAGVGGLFWCVTVLL